MKKTLFMLAGLSMFLAGKLCLWVGRHQLEGRGNEDKSASSFEYC